MDAMLSILAFVIAGLALVFSGLTANWILGTRSPNRQKLDIYECGEEPIGTGWVQFDLRFYIVALFYLVFDVEVALTYPWAIVFREFPTEALVLGMPFILLIVLGFAYEWHTGALEWVRSTVNTSLGAPSTNEKLSALARKDPV
jgi:NADH-quinone oxidoreductase subunit A